jgi:hypothetical protein
MRFRPLLALSILSNKQTRLYSSIKNIEKPSCNTCKFYNPEEYTYFDSTTSKCLLYGNKNLHDGNIEYLYATECRKNESTCGEQGKLYEPDKFIHIKKMSHNLSRFKVVYFIGFLYSSLLFLKLQLK